LKRKEKKRKKRISADMFLPKNTENMKFLGDPFYISSVWIADL